MLLLAGLVSGQVVIQRSNTSCSTWHIDSCLLVGSAGTVGDARSKIGGGKISDARFGLAASDSSCEYRVHFSGMFWQLRGKAWTQDRSSRR